MSSSPMALSPSVRRTLVGKDVIHDERLELGVVARARRHRDRSATRQPDKIARYVVADDRDHLADHCDLDVAVRAALDFDQLLGVAADLLVQAEKIEIGVFEAHVLDLKDAAGALGVVAEVWRLVQAK